MTHALGFGKGLGLGLSIYLSGSHIYLSLYPINVTFSMLVHG